MLNLGKELAQQSKAVLNLPKEKTEKLRQMQEHDAQKYKLLRSIFVLNSNGNIKKDSIKNVVAILDNDPIFKGAFQYNEFSEENEITKEISQLHIKKKALLLIVTTMK